MLEVAVAVHVDSQAERGEQKTLASANGERNTDLPLGFMHHNSVMRPQQLVYNTNSIRSVSDVKDRELHGKNGGLKRSKVISKMAQNSVEQSYTVLYTASKGPEVRFDLDRVNCSGNKTMLSIAETGALRASLEDRGAQHTSSGTRIVRKCLAREMREWLEKTKRVLPRGSVGTRS